jgi:hypothetical protein
MKKHETIYNILSPYGLSKTGAIRLSRIENLIEKLENTGPNPNPMPQIPDSSPHYSSKIRYEFRKSMADYLSHWIELPANLGWQDYVALARYYNLNA